MELFLGRRRPRRSRQRHRRQRPPDVRRILDPRASETSLSDRAGARRRRTRARLDGHSRRPSRLGHISCTRRLPRLRCRPPRPRPLALPSADPHRFPAHRRAARKYLRTLHAPQSNRVFEAAPLPAFPQSMGRRRHRRLERPRPVRSLARRRVCTNPRTSRSPRRAQSSPESDDRASASSLARTRRSIARQNRTRHHHDPLRRRPLRLAGRRDPSEFSERHHRRRRRRPILHRRQHLGHVHDSRRLRSAGQGCLRAQTRGCSVTRRRRRALQAASRARAQTEKSARHSHRHRDVRRLLRVAW